MSSLSGLKDHLVTAIATAAMLGGGGTLIANKVIIGRLDERVSAIENLAAEMDQTQQELIETRIAIAQLSVKAEEE